MTLATIVILMTLHPTLVKQVLAFFKCTHPVQNNTYLIADVDIACESGEHTSMILSLALPALFFYIVGIPLVAGGTLYLNRHNLDLQETKETIGFLYSNYEPAYFGWELVIILRLVAMASVSVLFEGMFYIKEDCPMMITI